MTAPPNFVTTNARAHKGKVRVDMAAPPTSCGIGFVYSLSPDVAESLAEQLVAAAKLARLETQTKESKQSVDADSGG